MPQPFERRYTDEQKAAMAYAYEDRRIRPARVVVDLAGRGELQWEGATVESFETNDDQVRYEASQLRRRRAGQRTSELAKADPRDAVEALRRRLVNLVDALLTDLEEKARKDKSAVDPERVRQLARAAKEAAALPGPKDPRPAPSGTRHKDGEREPRTNGGLGGTLLSANRKGDAQPAQERLNRQEGSTEKEGAALEDDAAQEAEGDGGPGSLSRELGHALASPAGAAL